MMATERSEIQWGRTPIPYQIRRSARRGTVSVAVEPSGEVVLTAPTNTAIERLDRLVRQKARWIVERVRRGSDLARPVRREFVSGETVLYLGRNYRLRVNEATNSEPTRLDHGWLVITVACGLSPADQVHAVRHGMIAWYRRHAQAQLADRTERWAKRLRIRPRGILIRDPERRWGSCDPVGTLRFSWRIVQAPSALVDYVVVHELLHLEHRRHTSQFWAAVGRVLPNYEALRARLRALGSTLLW